jgi:hypothetical protein
MAALPRPRYPTNYLPPVSLLTGDICWECGTGGIFKSEINGTDRLPTPVKGQGSPIQQNLGGQGGQGGSQKEPKTNAETKFQSKPVEGEGRLIM